MGSLAFCIRTVLVDPDDLAAVRTHIEVAGSEEAGVQAFLAELNGELEGLRGQLIAQGFEVTVTEPAAPQEELPALISTSLQTGKTKRVDLKKPAPATADMFGSASPTAPAEAARNWQSEGDAAFKAGKNRIVPVSIWKDVTAKEGNKRADAWYKGWDRANLAAPVPETSALPGDFRPGEDVEITQTAQGLRVGDSVDVPSRTIGRSVIEALWSRNTMGNKATDFARLRNAEGKKLIVIGSALRNNKTDPFTPTNTETDRDTFLYAIKRNERVKTKAGIFSIRDRGNLGWTVIEHNDGYNVEKGPGPMEKWGKEFAAERAAEEAGLTPGTQQAQIATASKEGTDNGPAAGTGLREGSPTVSGAEQPGSAGEAAGPASVPQPGGPRRGADAPAAIGPDAVGDQQPVQEPARTDAGQAAGTGSNPGDGGRTDNGRTDPAAIAKNVEAEREIALPPNYQITEADHVGEGGPKAKVAANLEALRLLKVLEAENRKASPSEQAVLVRYVGWGAFAQDMFQDAKPEWAKERAELKSLLTTEEYDSARASVLNAHYTSPEVIKGMWGAMEYLGFTGGRAIEPASGVGHFIGMTPAALRDKVKWTATELDKVTGAIAQQLYQRADVNVQGFETLNRPNGFYDVAISNVPFGSFNIRDLRYKDEYLIHDYFFIRSLDLVRPGGVVAFITSSGTMDKASDSARAEIMKRADLLGAIRLPGGKKGAFAGNAGTEVTTDILFLRRKGPGLAAIATEWQNLKEIQTPDGPTRVNEYFAARPEMMLGQMRLIGSMYRDKSPVLEGDATNLEGRILDAARQMPANSYTRAEGAPLSEAKVIDKETSGRTKEGAFYLEGNKVMRKVLGLGSEPGLSAVDQDKVRRLVQMRDAVSQLLNVARDRSKDALVRQRLNSQYDDFVKKYGPINRETVSVTSRLNKAGENIVIRRLPNMAAFRADPDAYKVAAIENYDAEKDTATKAALFSGEVVSDSPAAELKNAIDGIGWSLNAFGELNMTAIGDRLGKSKQQIIDELGDRVFLNPNGDRWEPAEQYLAGDVVEKLDDARAAAEADRAYQRNVAALDAVQPEQLNQEDITVPFGAAWVPGSVYEQFLEEVIGTTGKAKVALNPVTKQYSLAGVNFSISAQTQFGTNKVGVAEIISHAFQMKSPRVTETVRTPEGGTKDVVNEEATREAQVKTQLVRKIFEGDIQEGAEGWVWQDADRGELLAKLYNRKFNRLVQQKFDGSHLTFPGLATVITDGSGNVIPFALREHQKASVWRAVQNGNTLLDHVVGAGKTFTMIAAAMEMKRLGQIQRPMFIVPNHMLEQFSREFLQAYPNANILVAQKDEMTRSNRKAFAAKIAAERWDGIVITHDAFGRLPLSKEVYVKFMKDEIAEIEAAIRHMKAMQNKKDPTVKQLESMKKRAETRMKKLIATERKDEGVLFEELGVDQLILDEAHLFKNLQFYTQHTRVKGLAQGASQRAMDMFLKVRELEKTRPGRSAIFATGTPISNTMAEMYTMQRYLQLDELVKLGIDRFDAWAATFGEIRTNMELSPDGRTFRETSSFSRFRNLPELVALYSKMADTKTADMLNLPRPKLKDGKPIIVEAEPSAAEEVYIQGLVTRAEQVRGKKAVKGGDNMLKVVSEGRKVALDYRLIEPEYAEMNPRGKVAMMVERAVAVWRAGNEDQVAKAQLIFCDMGVPFTEQATPVPVPEAEAAIDEELEVDDNADDAEEVDADESEALRSRYNLYEEIRRQLVAKGIPKQQIAFIHEAKDDSKKAALFEKVRRGEVRILLGSTGKMGVGTNVQKRLKAMHHLDAPWKPAEVEQRDGRILRQGNMNPEIEIYRYITKRSFDSFMWQTLERKANFIAQIKAGARGVRIAEDIDSPLPEAAELKAAASGDPRIMQHAELTKEVRDLEARFSSHVRTIGQARRDMAVRQDELAKLEKQLPQVAADAAKVPVTAGDNFKVDLLVGKKGEYTKRAEAGAVMAAFLAEQAALPTKGVFKLTVARFNGLEIVAALNNRLEQPGVTLAVKGYMGRGLEFGLAVDRTPQLDAALMSRMESELADLGVVKGNMEYRIAQIQKELPKIEVAAEDRPFPRMERMKQAKQELSDLTKALGEEKNKKPAGPMIMGNTGTPEQQERAARASLPIRKTIETALSGFGYKIVDTGLPFGYTDRWGKLHSFGTQIIDKAIPGSDIGKWMDKIANAGPETAAYIKENMTAPWAHRVWFGHDPLANIAAVVEKFGAAAIPEYALQLFKDGLTKAGVPLPGTQWLVHAGLVGDRTATAWLSLNIGEALSGGLSILGTYRLMKQVRNGEPVHRGWAIAGILFKMVGGVLSANPVVLLSAAADVVLLTRATVDGVRRGAAQIEQAAPIKARRGAGPGIYGNLAEAPAIYPAPISVTATRAQINAAANEVDRLTQQMLGRKVKTFTNDVMPSFIPPEFIAAYGEGNRTIYITMRAAHDLANNVGHESLHAMRQLGLINGAEWTAMVAMAKKQGFAPTPRSIELYRREYVGRFGLTEAEFADKLDEESVARLFGNYVATREALTPWSRKVIDKLLEWADAVLVAIRAAGVEVKARDVMAKAYRGDLAGREEGRGALALDQLAVAGAAQDVTQTPAFKSWFRGSKAVDADGKPLVVYHGTTWDISDFARGMTADDAFYFTPDQETASWFAEKNGTREDDPQPNVMPLFISVKNPKVMTLEQLKAEIGDEMDDATGIDWTAMPNVVAQARREGYDGMHLVGVKEYNGKTADQWLAFEAGQVKSVFNGGKFDPSNPAILGNTPDGSGGGGGPSVTAAAIDAQAEAALDDLAGNINLRRIQAPDDIKAILKQVATDAEGFMAERRGVVSNEQTAALAAELGMTAAELMNRETGAAFNAHTIFAARSLLLKSAQRVKAMAKVARGSQSLSDLAEFQKVVLRHRAIQEQVAGMTAEAGRALQQFNMIAGKDYLRGLDAIISDVKNTKGTFGSKAKGDEEMTRELAGMIAALDDPAQIGKFIADARKVTFGDKLRELWINGLLSGPRTHATNIMSNTLTALWQVPETYLAETIGRFHGGDKVASGETAARLVGLIEGAKEGMIAAAHLMKTGEPIDAISKVEANQRRAIPGKLGSVIRTPSRLLEAEDQFFKAVNYRAEINALAVRMALKEGRKGQSLAKRIAELRAAPSHRMQAEAHKAALYQTFQNKLGAKGQMVMNLREAVPLGWLILPFIRTPANILKFAAERTPLGLAMKPVRDNLSGLNGTVARDVQLARMAMGSAIMLAVVSMAAAGSITGGGPDDPEEERMLRATGWQPYSLKIGDAYVSYQRMDPIALVVGIAADAVQISEHLSEADLNKVATLLVNAVAGNIKEKTWISGLVGFMEAFFSGDAWKLEGWGRRLGGSVVPAVVAQTAQWMDPQVREARGLVDTLKSRVPGLSKTLLPRRNVFGETITREGAVGPDLLSPLFVSSVKDNRLAREALRLGYFPSMPNRLVNGHKLTAEQYDRYVELSGRSAVERMKRRMAGERWNGMDSDAQIKLIRDAFNDARDEARDALKKEWPALRKKAGSE